MRRPRLPATMSGPGHWRQAADKGPRCSSLLRELGIDFVPYRPLGCGVLTGRIRSLGDLAPGDWRREMSRFEGESFRRNLDVAAEISRAARERGCTPAELAARRRPAPPRLPPSPRSLPQAVRAIDPTAGRQGRISAKSVRGTAASA